MMLLDDAAPDTFEVDDDLVKTIDDYLMTFVDVPLTGDDGQAAELAISNLIVANVAAMIAIMEQNQSEAETAWSAVKKWSQTAYSRLADIRQTGQPDETS